MGIYLPNMEMPKGKAVSLLILTNGNVYKDGICFAKKAVPVPSHGRVVDADAFIEKCEEMADKEDGNQLDALVLLKWFLEQNAPTIIPAEEGET